MQTFHLGGTEYIELHNLLKTTGLCENGGIAKAVIADGLVKVDGMVEMRKRCKIRSGQTVDFQGQCIAIS